MPAGCRRSQEWSELNPYLANLQPYPFQRLTALLREAKPPAERAPIAMSIGEPRHTAPKFIADEIATHIDGLSKYPATPGGIELRTAIASWLERRFSLKESSLDPNQNVLPVNGTREALFAIAQCLVNAKTDALVLMPNPFYQIYEGAAILAGAEPWFVNIDDTLAPDFDSVPEQVWHKCQLLYLCSPGNPTGAVLSVPIFQKLIALADKYDFVIASDECYSEIYLDDSKPPVGLLQAASLLGRDTYDRCLVFNSLSKRSSVPGLRSGLVAGDKKLIEKFSLYRTYHGSAMSPPVQAASVKAWQDEEHVRQSRELYCQKFQLLESMLSSVIKLPLPQGGFFLWLTTTIDDKDFAYQLYNQYNLTVLPGSFLSRVAHGVDPGKGYVRIAVVGSLEETKEAGSRLKDFLQKLGMQ